MKFSLPASIFVSPAMAVMLAVGISLLPSSALAQGTPDGQTPAEETVCDGLEGAAFGLCNAYCEATDCGDGVNYASMQACASLQKNWAKKTGTREFPCDCAEGDVFIPGEGCACGVDLIVTILALRPLGCPTGQGSCEFLVDIEVENLGSQDVLDPFSVFVELPGVPDSETVNFPGLPAGGLDQAIGIPFGPGNNCFDPNCEVFATVDPGNDIPECDEDNNTDFLLELG